MPCWTPPAQIQSAPTPDPFRLLQSGDLAAAERAFRSRATARPEDADAWLGLGLALGRQKRYAEAEAALRAVLARVPSYPDAHLALGAFAVQQGRLEEGEAHFRRGLAHAPAHPELRRAFEDATGLPFDAPPPSSAPAPPVPARVRGRAFEVRTRDGGWTPLFLKGVNLGAALPGRHASEFPDEATYAGWLAEMAELGVNTLRVYTIHSPAFYRALEAHNRTAPHPIYLLHGVWTELPPHHDYDDPAFLAAWHGEMAQVVDVLHGRARLRRTPGKAHGAYTADVSGWTLGIILGREWESSSVVAYNRAHPGLADWEGRFVAVTGGHAMERWLARSLDRFLTLEWERTGTQRPMAFTNWPTLDPLHHPTESTAAEEDALRRRRGLPSYGVPDGVDDEDAVGLDLEKFRTLPACRTGLFASYHAYPYYPDFMNLDPGYGRARDAEGPSHYTGYLADLTRHHARHPVLIAEFGVPSSRMVAHWQPEGLTHGGQNEREQGRQDARLFRNIYDTGCAGGILFAWIDEWFKKNWLALPFMRPLERVPLWYNAADAEENYGLIAYHPGAGGPTITLDGRAEDWAGVPTYLEGNGYRLQARADEGWLHLALTSPAPLNFTREAVVIGLDTLDPQRGDVRLPWGLPLRSRAGLEFVVAFQGEGRTGVYADEPYALPEHRWKPSHRYRTEWNETGRFVMPTAKSNHDRVGRDGTPFPGHATEVGWLRRGTSDRRDPAFDSLAEWQTGRLSDGRGFLEARIPWDLLNVADPSSRRVLDDPPGPRPGPEVGTSLTEGFRMCLAVVDASTPLPDGGGRVRLTLPAAVDGIIAMPPTFAWPGWERPTFHRARKAPFDAVRQVLRDLPDCPKVP